jgi:hypothetical protein
MSSDQPQNIRRIPTVGRSTPVVPELAGTPRAVRSTRDEA